MIRRDWNHTAGSLTLALLCGSLTLVPPTAFASLNTAKSTITSPANAAALPPPVNPAKPHYTSRDEIKAKVLSAWEDSIATWKTILKGSVLSSEWPDLNFVEEIAASHCYGLYAGAGPVYCSGNSTVFVSIAALERMQKSHRGIAGAGLTFLVAHELGHHVQKISGRFQLLSDIIRHRQGERRDLTMRFELEADCLAGIWSGESQVMAQSSSMRQEMRVALDVLGDDKVQLAATGRVDPSRFTHGSSEQRRHWFERGYNSGGDLNACNALGAATP